MYIRTRIGGQVKGRRTDGEGGALEMDVSFYLIDGEEK